MKSTLLIVSIVLFTAIGCIDPIKLSMSNEAGQLVVDGVITNEPGPYTITLSRSIPFDNTRPLRVYAVPESKAKVTISDGNLLEILWEKDPVKAPGVYYTNVMQGKTGNTYTITITTAKGEEFSSEPETMMPVPKVDTLLPKFEVYDRFFMSSNGTPKTAKALGFKINAVVTDPVGFGNGYLWRASGIYQYETYFDFPVGQRCWAPVDKLESGIVTVDDQLFDGSQFSQEVVIVPYDRASLYQVKLIQSSLTEKAYAFWKITQGQQTSTGSIFDAPPTTINGNVVNAKGERALGYFAASSVTRYDYTFDRFKVSGFKTPEPNPPTLTGDCRMQNPRATTVKPAGF